LKLFRFSFISTVFKGFVSASWGFRWWPVKVSKITAEIVEKHCANG